MSTKQGSRSCSLPSNTAINRRRWVMPISGPRQAPATPLANRPDWFARLLEAIWGSVPLGAATREMERVAQLGTSSPQKLRHP
jgi:hypothetical protein